jgi:heme/copper-type cytochrome/quinol oxidase subunit 3
MNRNKVLMLFFVGSEAFFFLTLIIAYVYYSHPGGTLSDTAKYLDIKKTSIFTFFLLASSVTIEFAVAKFHQKNRRAYLAWLITTIVFGAVFLIGQMMEYGKLIESDVTVSKNVFGSAFFILTGFHGFHVFAGLIILLIVFGLIYNGNFKNIETTAFNSAAIYWHFVDAVWVAVFSIVYIGAIV